MPKPIFTPSSIQPVTFRAGRRAESVVLPEASSGVVSMPIVPDGMTFDPLTRRLTGHPLNIRKIVNYPYVATDGADISILNFPIAVELSPRTDTHLHGCQIFYLPRHLEASKNKNAANSDVPQITDNDFKTYSTNVHFRCNVTENGSNTKVTHVFLKSKNVDSVRIGMGSANTVVRDYEPIDAFVNKWEGTPTKTTVSGYQHALIELPDPVTTSQIHVQVQGSQTQIHELYILEEAWFLNSNARHTDVLWGRENRTGGEHINEKGDLEVYFPIGANRSKHIVNYTSYFEREPNFPLGELDEFVDWADENPNVFFNGEFTRYPNRCFLGSITTFSYQYNPVSQITPAGVTVNLQIKER